MGRKPASATGRTVSRRQYIVGAGAGILTSQLAGCMGQLGGDDVVKIGAAIPSSGGYALVGESAEAGFDLRMEQIDYEIDGVEVEVIKRDTATDPSTAVSVTEELIDREEVDFIVGPGTSSEGLAVMENIRDSGVTWMNTIAGDYRIIQDGCLNNHFVTTPLEYQVSAPLGPYVYDNIADNVYIIKIDAAYGDASMEFFLEEFEEKGGELVDEISAAFGTSDFSSHLQQIRDADPDAVYPIFAGEEGINFVSQYHEMGLDEEMQLVGQGYLVGGNTIPVLGEAAIGAITLHPYTPEKETSRNVEFVSNYMDAYDIPPDIFSCQGYDSAQAIEKAVSDSGGSTDAADIRDALAGTEIDSPRGNFQFDPDTHVGIMDMDIRVAREGDELPENEVVETIPDVGAPDFGCSF